MNADSPRLAFAASTGRTATMLMATVLNSIPGVTALHEGQDPDDQRAARLPLINVQNRQAWSSDHDARSVVGERRALDALTAAADGSSLIIDVAFYNSPLVHHLAEAYPDAALLVIVRQCEGFVRSATILEGEDRQPAGWPDPAKALTDRERFIQLGRLRPARETSEGQKWAEWSGVQRNIWLWATINRHLLDFADESGCATVLRFEDLRAAPEQFWSQCLAALDLDSPENRQRCLAGSSRPVNARDRYQVGPLQTWSQAEQDLYDQLARPLEERLND